MKSRRSTPTTPATLPATPARPLNLAAIRGHDHIIHRLRQALTSGRMGSAYLLGGPRGIGKAALAQAFAAFALCKQPHDDDACGTCNQCVRLAAGTHPDLQVLARDPERRDIGVEAARGVTRWLSLRPLMANRKVVIVDGAETLSVPAQNALLKSVEEPPGQAVILLLATTATLLLPTIRSRCQLLRLEPLPDDAVSAILTAHDIPAERIALLAARAEGSPGRALELANEPEDGIRQMMLTALPQLRERSTAELSALAQKIGPDADAALAIILGWYRDALGIALGVDAQPRRNPDAAVALQALAAHQPPPQMLRALQIVCATIDDVGHNANRQLALETMLFDIRDLERGTLHE